MERSAPKARMEMTAMVHTELPLRFSDIVAVGEVPVFEEANPVASCPVLPDFPFQRDVWPAGLVTGIVPATQSVSRTKSAPELETEADAVAELPEAAVEDRKGELWSTPVKVITPATTPNLLLLEPVLFPLIVMVAVPAFGASSRHISTRLADVSRTVAAILV